MWFRTCGWRASITPICYLGKLVSYQLTSPTEKEEFLIIVYSSYPIIYLCALKSTEIWKNIWSHVSIYVTVSKLQLLWWTLINLTNSSLQLEKKAHTPNGTSQKNPNAKTKPNPNPTKQKYLLYLRYCCNYTPGIAEHLYYHPPKDSPTRAHLYNRNTSFGEEPSKPCWFTSDFYRNSCCLFSAFSCSVPGK